MKYMMQYLLCVIVLSDMLCLQTEHRNFGIEVPKIREALNFDICSLQPISSLKNISEENLFQKQTWQPHHRTLNTFNKDSFFIESCCWNTTNDQINMNLTSSNIINPIIEARFSENTVYALSLFAVAACIITFLLSSIKLCYEIRNAARIPPPPPPPPPPPIIICVWLHIFPPKEGTPMYRRMTLNLECIKTVSDAKEFIAKELRIEGYSKCEIMHRKEDVDVAIFDGSSAKVLDTEDFLKVVYTVKVRCQIMHTHHNNCDV